ncbi:MAG: hypothetical protein QN125_00845 [Armatimonadota bacterium]|nr:hypothetical protein [Armatimonadota bacterium]MDR7455819.1 hypothetical protein [Armatimonadota bacterium]
MTHEGATWLLWLEHSGLGLAMRRSLWLYPFAEIVHILGIALLVGPAMMFDLRLLGWSRQVSVTAMAGHLLPWSRRGLALVAVSGVLMFTAHATEWVVSPVFWVKMSLIALAGVNVLVFHRRTFRSAVGWDAGAPVPRPARAAAVCSLALWTGAIACGRLLGYL